MGFWSNLGGSLLSTLTGGLVSGGVGAGLGALGAAQSQKNSLALIKQQEESQRALNAENAQMNYEYGEQAADAAHQRGLNMYQIEKEDSSAASQVQDLKDAGLNVGLLYGGGGAGGGASVGSGAQGDGAGNQKSQAANYLEVEAMKQQRKMADAELARTVNEGRLVEAEKRKLEAETEEIKSNIWSTEDKHEIEKELLRQEGIEKFIENTRKRYAQGDNSYGSTAGHTLGEVRITEGSAFTKQVAAEVAETISRVELNTERKKALWKELMIAQEKNETEKIKATAIKLAAEWSTGDYTNWKTWVSLSKEGVGTLIDIAKTAK